MGTIDRTTQTWTKVAAVAAVAGGVMWLGKQVVIAASVPATGGPPPESLLIAVFYLSGAALMVIGASGVVARVTVGWMTLLRVVAAVVLSPLLFWGLYTLVDMACDAIAGPDSGWWWPGEGAILITGLLFAAAGTTALLARRRELATAS